MKNICILGSTGSIGSQSLEVIKKRTSEFNVSALSANSNFELLYKQAIEFKPENVVIMNTEGYNYLKEKLKNYGINVLLGMEGLIYISTLKNVDIVLTSVVGIVGLIPTIEAIKSNKIIALANKETLVAGGDIIKKELLKSKAKIIPVDSEHCALFQCIKCEDKKAIRKLIITASGGPFRGKKRNDLNSVTPLMAIKHPKWNMGKKISIDSATLMNKGLEVIEAHQLFDIDYDNIEVIVHPQSIIHSMVEYNDGSILAQLSNTDMRHPIQYAFDYPNRNLSSIGYLDLVKNNILSFESPDLMTFECLSLGYKAGKIGGSMPAVLNAANEEAVNMFLKSKIKFLEIQEIIKLSMDNHKVVYDFNLDNIIEIDRKTREYVKTITI